MPRRCREFVDSRLRRSPPDRASAVPYGQAGENAMRFPHLAHRSAAAHKLHSTTAARQDEFDSGKSETISRLLALAYSPRKLSKEPEPSHSSTISLVGVGVASPFTDPFSHRAGLTRCGRQRGGRAMRQAPRRPEPAERLLPQKA